MIIVDDYLNDKEMDIWRGLTYRRSSEVVTVSVGELQGLLIALAIERRARMDATPPAPPPGRVLENVRR